MSEQSTPQSTPAPKAPLQNTRTLTPREQFRAIAAERLRAEREPAGPTPEPSTEPAEDTAVETPKVQASKEPARGPTEDAPETEGTVDAASDESGTLEGSDEDTSEPEEGSLDWYRAEIERATEARKSMERDYRIKTQKIAEARRHLEGNTKEVMQMAGFYANLADSAVSRFQNVNWDALRTKPEEFNRVKAQYDQAVAQRNQIKAGLEQLSVKQREAIEQAKRAEAELSREILSTTVPDWSSERYRTLREFADKESLFSPDEFNQITDWRTMYLLNEIEKVRSAPKTISPPQAKASPPKRRTGTQPAVPTPRDASGKFTSATKLLQMKPGDKAARRDFFRAKLAAERENAPR